MLLCWFVNLLYMSVGFQVVTKGSLVKSTSCVTMCVSPTLCAHARLIESLTKRPYVWRNAWLAVIYASTSPIATLRKIQSSPLKYHQDDR
jgi:hypothetical protein